MIGEVEKEIATIGDMANDLLMFRKSGFSIAMGNAAPEVKAQARRSVATALEGQEVLGSAIEPLHAIYRKSCLNALRARLWSTDRKVEHAIEGLRVRRLSEGELRAHDPLGMSLRDIDTPEALAEAEHAVLAEEGTPWRGSVPA